MIWHATLKLAVAATFLLSLSGCQLLSTLSGASRPKLSVVTYEARIPADSELLKRCGGVSDVPHRDLTEPEVGTGWGTDRSRLGECAPRHNALVDALEIKQGPARPAKGAR